MRRCIEIVIATAGGRRGRRPRGRPPRGHAPAAHLPAACARGPGARPAVGAARRRARPRRLGAAVVAKPDDGRLAVDVPGWRPDLTAEIDLVEEVARVHGYDRLPDELRPFRVGALPDAPAVPVLRRLPRDWWPRDCARWSACRSVRRRASAAWACSTRSAGGRVPAAGAPARAGRPRGAQLDDQVRDVRLFEVGTVFARAGAGGAPGSGPGWLPWSPDGASRPIGLPPRPDVDRCDGKGLAEAVAALAFPGASWHVRGGRVGGPRRGRPPGGLGGSAAADAPPWAAPLFGVEVDVALVVPGRAVVRPLPTTPAGPRPVARGRGWPRGGADRGRHPGLGGRPAGVGAHVRGVPWGPGGRGTPERDVRLACRAPDRTLRESGRLERRVLDALAQELGLDDGEADMGERPELR